MTVVTRVYIVRHGETDHNREGIMQGQLDTPLNDAGIEQAQLAADALEDVPFSAAFSSDLQRASKTAEIILEKHPDIQLETTAVLRERFMGDWQGEVIAKRGDPPANLEPVLDFMTRSLKWWNDVVVRRAQRNAAEIRLQPSRGETGVGDRMPNGRAEGGGEMDDDGDFEPEHILVVSHGGLIGSLVTNLVGSRKLRMEKGVLIGRCFNASISVVEIDEGLKGRLVSYADTTHLNGDLVQDNADVHH